MTKLASFDRSLSQIQKVLVWLQNKDTKEITNFIEINEIKQASRISETIHRSLNEALYRRGKAIRFSLRELIYPMITRKPRVLTRG